MSGAVASKTPNIGLSILRFDFPNWGDDANKNTRIIDAMSSLIGLSISGAWEVSTPYTVGQLVVDSGTNEVFRVLIAHISAASGTFAADRIANPTYWQEYSQAITFRGAWVDTTQYYPNDIITNGNYKYGIAVQSFISDGSFNDDVSDNKIEVFFDGEATVTVATNAKNAAELAKTNAETAETNAETAQGLAESARDAAALSKTAAETAETNAETAQGLAEAARDEAVNVVSDSVVGAVRHDTSQTIDGQSRARARGNIDVPVNVIPSPGGRLTLESGVPVSATDQDAKSTLYYTPYMHNVAYVYGGGTSKWLLKTFAELSLDISAFSAGVYDIFLYNNAGSLALEALAWASNTARATALVRQDGVLVKSGDTGKLYVGTICTALGGTCSDTKALRGVWNMYHRKPRPMKLYDATVNWTYNTTTIRQWRASTGNTFVTVCGLDEDPIDVTLSASVLNSTATIVNFLIGIGLDSTTAFTGTIGYSQINNALYWPKTVRNILHTGIGKHAINFLESGAAGHTQTVLGNGWSGGEAIWWA